MIPGIVRWTDGRPTVRAPFGVAFVDADNIIGNYSECDEREIAAKIDSAMGRVRAMIDDIAVETDVFVFFQMHKPPRITGPLETACAEHGFVLVHCCQKADRTDDVDAHMKRRLRRASLAYATNVPITIFSGDHTFAEEVEIIGRTHPVFLGLPHTHSSLELVHSPAQGRAWLMRRLTREDSIGLLFGTSLIASPEKTLKFRLLEPRYRRAHIALQIAVKRLLAGSSLLYDFAETAPDCVHVLAGFLTNWDRRQHRIGLTLARALIKQKVVIRERITEGESMGLFFIDVDLDHPIFQMEPAAYTSRPMIYSVAEKAAK